jgi:FkbM family methyltransferase
MMIRKIIVLIARLSGFSGYKASFGTRAKVFFPMLGMIFKGQAKTNPNKLYTFNFLNYKISGYSPHTIEYLINEIFLNNEYNFDASSNAPIILDCGSNIGVSVMYFLSLYPNAQITAFEPDPHIFKALKKNMEQNNLNVTLENCALCRQECTIPFYVNDGYGALTGSIINERGGENKIDVAGKQLSNFVAKYDRIDLIKIDVEGAELEVLDDLYSNNLLTRADNYAVEYHHNIKNADSNLSDFLRKFEENGFDYSIRTRYKSLGEFQDIFLHFYKRDKVVKPEVELIETGTEAN